MKRQLLKRIFWMTVTGCVAAAAFFWVWIAYFFPPMLLEKNIQEKIETQLGYRPVFAHFNVALFPFPQVHYYSFQLIDVRPDSAGKILDVPKITFRPALLPLMLGKVTLSAVDFQQGNLWIPLDELNPALEKTIELEDVSMSFKYPRSKHPVHFKLAGKIWDRSANLQIQGSFETDFDDPRIENTGLKAEVLIRKVELADFSKWLGSERFKINEGTSAVSFQFSKTPASSLMTARGNIQIDHLVYEFPSASISSVPASYRAEGELEFDLIERSMGLKHSNISVPFAEGIQAAGKVNYSTREIEELVVKLKQLKMDIAPRHILSFQEMLPVRLGLSGESDVDIFMKGAGSSLSANVRFDLRQSILTYSRFFSKPAGVPFVFRTDLKFSKEKPVQGNFSMEFEAASLKGSLVQLDPATGMGEMTLLTNNFSVEGWEKYVPFAREFALSGGLKFFSSAKGDLRNFDRVSVMRNFTFSDFGMTSSGGLKIEKLNGIVDIGPFEADFRNVSLKLGKSPLTVNGKMLRNPQVKWLIEAASSEMYLADMASQLGHADNAFDWIRKEINWPQIENFLRNISPGDRPLEQVNLQAGYANRQLVVTRMAGGYYGGVFGGDAFFDLNPDNPVSDINLELNRVNLARMAGAGDKPFLLGNLFAVAALKGTGPFDDAWADRLTGQGTFSVTNGEFGRFDVLKALGELKELDSLRLPATGSTRFFDLRSGFKIASSKMTTENMFLAGDTFQIEPEGAFDLNGKLNFRLAVYLLPELAAKLMKGAEPEDRLGPMPFLLVGTTKEPSLRKDPIALQNFLDQLGQGKRSKFISQSPEIPAVKQEEPAETFEEQVGKLRTGQLVRELNLLDEYLAKRKVSAS